MGRISEAMKRKVYLPTFVGEVTGQHLNIPYSTEDDNTTRLEESFLQTLKCACLVYKYPSALEHVLNAQKQEQQQIPPCQSF